MFDRPKPTVGYSANGRRRRFMILVGQVINISNLDYALY